MCRLETVAHGGDAQAWGLGDSMVEDFKLFKKFALARSHTPCEEGDGKGQKANRGHGKQLRAMLGFQWLLSFFPMEYLVLASLC